jgi:hypothetical protein
MVLFQDRKTREFEKDMNMQEPYLESSDESMSNDMSRSGVGGLPSSNIPEDFYQYKRFINLPESQAEFLTKIDKDVVFGNFGGSKPSLEELRFQVGTIELFEGEFVEEIKIPRRDNNGVFVKDKDGNIVIDTFLMFDEAFRSCLNFLKAEYKFSVVASRALNGTDRAAYLDISTNNRISKEFSKKREQKNSIFGTGG